MARVNIDELFYSDPRIILLSELTKEGLLMTRGRLITLWGYCYNRKKEILSEKEISLNAMWFDKERSFSDLMAAADLAESQTDGNYRLRGVGDRIKYLLDRAEYGRKSAVSRKKKYGTSRPLTKTIKKTNSSSQSNEQNVNILEPLPLHIPLPLHNNKYNTCSYEQGDIDLAVEWCTRSLGTNPHYEGKWTPEKFAREISKVRRVMKFTPERMREIFEFIKESEFWEKKVSSPRGLLRMMPNGQYKIDNLINSMGKKKPIEELRQMELVED